MISNFKTALATVLAGLVLAPASANAGSNPTGIWLNDTGRGAIEIKRCGRRLCGHVVWVKSSKDKKGCGRQIIGNVAKVGKRTWGRGWIYSPERGRRFDVELTPLKSGKLKVLGFAGSKFFSKTMYWTKAPQDLQLCGTATTAAKPKKAPMEIKATEQSQVKVDAADKPDEVVSENRASEPVQEIAKSDPTNENATAEAPKAPQEDDLATADVEDEDAGEIEELPPVANKGPDLGNLPIKKYFKKSGDKCKLDLPWVKIKFKCKNI